jgi:hypothetical protein
MRGKKRLMRGVFRNHSGLVMAIKKRQGTVFPGTFCLIQKPDIVGLNYTPEIVQR